MGIIPTTADNATLLRYINNIIDAWNHATPEQHIRGAQWYHTAHDIALVVGDGDANVGAGVLAVLSANKRWDVNVNLAKDAAAGNVWGHTRATLAKVQAILDGTDPADLLPMGLKTGHFYRAILDPDDPDTVVIDRHAHDIAVRGVHGNTDRGLSNKTRYATLAMAYRLAARKLDQIPNVVQAVTWVYQIETLRGHG